MSTVQEKRDQFEWWLTCIPDKVEALIDRLPPEVGSKLNYSLESLSLLEKHLIENYTVESMTKDKEFWDCLASYIGTTYRRLIPKAGWQIELENEKDVFYNRPVLVLEGSPFPPISPHTDVTTLLDRRKGVTLTKTVLNRTS